jgi:hypothetical protein
MHVQLESTVSDQAQHDYRDKQILKPHGFPAESALAKYNCSDAQHH